MNVRSEISMNDAYHEVFSDVKIKGSPMMPRGKPCVELRPYTLMIEDARLGLYTGKSRRLNYRFWAVETLMYLAGWGDMREHADLLIRTNPNVEQFRNKNTGIFDGAYGPRLRQSLIQIYDLFHRDSYTRQAVASVWSPGLEYGPDVPCTCLLQFFVTYSHNRVESLDLSVYMRSNDINWGLPYDVAAFCIIQNCLASSLGYNMGSYTHTTGSMHYYIDAEPEIYSESQETWLDENDPAHCMPLRKEKKDIVHQMSAANFFLEELYTHVIKADYQFHTFYSNMEIDPYWEHWANGITGSGNVFPTTTGVDND